MRKLMAVVALLCGAASAQAADQEWCIKYTEDGASLIKAPGIVYKLKHVRTDKADTEESEVLATDDGRFTVAIAENDAYWYNNEEQGEVIADCP